MKWEQLREVFNEIDEDQQVILSSLMWFILVWEQSTFYLMEILPLVLFSLRQAGNFNIFDTTRCFMDSIIFGQVFI